jgi:GAF domain-containing protein
VDDASDALADLWRVLRVDEPVEAALDRLTEVALKVITDADAVSVTAMLDGGPRTVATTHEWAVMIDKNQYAENDGPCLEAARRGETLMVSGTEAFSRWPKFAADSALYGVHAYLSAPLVLPGSAAEVAGALNVYGFREDSFDRLDEALVRLLTTAASATISNARRYAQMREVAENLRAAMDSRAEIEQAKGVLMAVHGVTAAEAFERLITQSQHSNTKLAVVARELLASMRKK